MENERTENIFYLDLKHVRKYGCAKFQPNPLFSSQQTATKSAAEEKKKKKSRQPLKGIPSEDGMPQIMVWNRIRWWIVSLLFLLSSTVKPKN